jgi:hypothetical protein
MIGQKCYRRELILLGLSLAAGFSTAGRAAEPAAAAAVPTFSREVAPIFQRRCQTCHRPGEVAPMSLLSYQDARPWAESIREEVSAKRMPPWHADPAHGRYSNDPTLTADELSTLLGWVDGGAPEGNPADLPPPKHWEAGWNISRPDVVITMPREYEVPATGTVKYQYFEVPTGFTEDRWVQAAEVRPGNRAVVHHVLVFCLPPKGKAEEFRRGNVRWDTFLVGVAPGEEPAEFRPGSAKKVPAGSTLLFQVHYTTNGKAAKDRSSVGLVFAREPVKTEVRTRAVANPAFLIPPGAPDHQVTSSYTFSRDGVLVSLMPHMHLRGKSFEYRATFPDGSEKVLLSVPRYDFNWQHSYRLAEPLPMPKGTRIHCTATYDNSAANKANPDPTKAVHWGDQTWEEMMIGFIDFSREIASAPAKDAGEPKPAVGGPDQAPRARF